MTAASVLHDGPKLFFFTVTFKANSRNGFENQKTDLGSFIQVFVHSSITVSEMDETEHKTAGRRQNPDSTE